VVGSVITRHFLSLSDIFPDASQICKSVVFCLATPDQTSVKYGCRISAVPATEHIPLSTSENISSNEAQWAGIQLSNTVHEPRRNWEVTTLNVLVHNLILSFISEI